MAPLAGTLEDVLETQIADADYWERLYNMDPASVTVSRTSEADFKQRQLIIHLDGERLGDSDVWQFDQPGSGTRRPPSPSQQHAGLEDDCL